MLKRRRSAMRCPKCNREYGREQAVCPADGCVLIEVPITAEAEIGPTMISGRTPKPRGPAPSVWGDEPEPELVGQVLDGRYRLLSLLDHGGMGNIYVGEQLNVERKVAVKVLRRGGSADPARFRAEAKIISGLRHPNTVKLFDYGITAEGVAYLVTELLSGEPLSAVLERGPLTPARTLSILREVCLSLEEAHALGVVHRDLKPANIFLDQVGGRELVKVLDFGIAKVSQDSVIAQAQDPRRPETLSGVLIGTPAYISPEQAHGKPVDAKSDLYALGAVAYHCLTGQLPFPGETVAQLAGHATLPVRRFAELDPPAALDPRLEALVLRLMAKDPAGRPDSARALAEEVTALERALSSGTGGRGEPAATPGAGDTPPRPARAGSPALWIGGVLAGAAAAMLFLHLRLGPLPETGGDAQPLALAAADDARVADAEQHGPDGQAADVPPADATTTSTVAPPLLSGEAGRVSLVARTGWRDPQAVEPSARRIGEAMLRCHRPADEREAPATRQVRFEVGRTVAMSVEPADSRFASCLALDLPAQLPWPSGQEGETAVLTLELKAGP